MEKRKNPIDAAQQPETVPYFAYQGMVYTQERYHKRVVGVLCAIIVVLMVWAGTETILRHKENAAWLSYIEQYDFTDYVYTQDGRGVNIIGYGNGVDYDGPTSDNTDENQEESQLSAWEGNPQA